MEDVMAEVERGGRTCLESACLCVRIKLHGRKRGSRHGRQAALSCNAASEPIKRDYQTSVGVDPLQNWLASSNLFPAGVPERVQALPRPMMALLLCMRSCGVSSESYPNRLANGSSGRPSRLDVLLYSLHMAITSCEGVQSTRFSRFYRKSRCCNHR